MIILPRQARDKHRKNSKKSEAFLQVMPDPHSPGNVTIAGHAMRVGQSASLSFGNSFGASGPLPHTRYLQPGGARSWSYDSSAEGGAPIRLAAGAEITDDDGIGGVSNGTASDFCVELSHAGNVEAWHAPLSDGRHAVAFVNRSPAPKQSMTLELTPEMLGASDAEAAKQRYTVKDVWGGKMLPGTVNGVLDAVVEEAHGVRFFILTPSTE
jgi:hypothetical protein